ncbi:MAG TPA: phosphotransferase [Thermoanaerobaculia bacterium]|nr:phosphotransferase [Thermoanaerobaculia bacterium]
MTFKYTVVSGGGARFIVRFYPPGREDVVEYEPDVVRRCRSSGLRVPEVVADSRSGPPAPLAYMAYRMIDGIALRDRLADLADREMHSVCASVAEQMRAMAEVRIDGYGDLTSAHEAQYTTWQSFIRAAFEDGIAAAGRRMLLEDALIDTLRTVCDHLDRFAAPETPVLTWGDLSPDNIIVQGGRLAGLIDFEGVLGGEPELNLGYVRARYRETPFYEALLAHWPCVDHDQPRTALYVVVRGLRLLIHRHELLPTGERRQATESFLSDFAAAVNELRAWISGDLDDR